GGAARALRRAGENGARGGRRLARSGEVRDAEEGGADRAGLHDRVGGADPDAQGEAARGGEELQTADRAGVRGGGSHRRGCRGVITPARPPTAPAPPRAASGRPAPSRPRPRSPAAVPAAAPATPRRAMPDSPAPAPPRRLAPWRDATESSSRTRAG